MKGIIYKYTFPDGKVYIGQTRRHPEKRKREHLDKIAGPSNTRFWEAIQKLGEPKYEVIYEVECDSIDELVWRLNDAETYFIQVHRACDPDYGYNVESRGHSFTDAREIIHNKYNELMEEKLPERLKVYNSLIGKLLKGKRLTEDELFLAKEQYRDINPHQSWIDEYNFDKPSANDDEVTDFLLDDAIPFIEWKITADVREEVSNYIYDNLEKILYEERRKKAIVQLDKGGKVMREFFSLNEICQAFNVQSPQNVLNVLKGKQKTAYGFLWKYARDIE
jgi:hypothetical protein